MIELGGDEPGQTPVDPDDAQHLRPAYASIRTRSDLNDAEASNITDAVLWLAEQNLAVGEVLNQSFLRELHRRMFADVWSWAGQLRRRDTSIGVEPAQIQERLQALLGDVGYWTDHRTFTASEICVRFHHQLVFIPPFVNGNGRHGRLAAGALAEALGLGSTHLTWGARPGRPVAEARQEYLMALREADRGQYARLIAAVSS